MASTAKEAFECNSFKFLREAKTLRLASSGGLYERQLGPCFAHQLCLPIGCEWYLLLSDTGGDRTPHTVLVEEPVGKGFSDGSVVEFLSI